MRRLHRGKGHGFSIVEMMVGLTIMSLLVGVTVTSYGDSAQRARETVAQDESKAIASAIQRWQLENKRLYMFESPLPLVPRYLKSISNDPWKNLYRVDSTQKIVYSFGRDGVDDAGAGDDIAYFYDTTGDVAPGPPQGLMARLDNDKIKFRLNAPQRNADGSQPVTDLDRYVIYIRSAKETVVRTFQGAPNGAGWVAIPDAGSVVNAEQTTGTVQTLFGAGAFEQSYYFTARAIDDAGNLSGPSNQAGLFVSKEVGPQIVRFRPSSLTPAVSSPFSFSMEVTDADSNLSEVVIRGWPSAPGTSFSTPGGSGDEKIIVNPFKFVHNYVPDAADMTVGTKSGIYLYAEDASGNTTRFPDVANELDISFVNNPPYVSALTPGIKLLTVRPLVVLPVNVEFNVEALDREANLVNLRVERYTKSINGVSINTTDSFVDFPIPPGSAMVRTQGFTFPVDQKAEFEVRAVARDSFGVSSQARVTKVLVKEDTTPPDAVSLSIDRSNPLLTTNPLAGAWFINTPDHILADPQAFEIESPPITYQFKITTHPFGPTWETAPSVNQTHGSSDTEGWFDVFDPLDFHVKLQVGNGLVAAFDEEEFYYMGVRAMNSTSLINMTTAQPENVLTLQLQNPFRLDATPPQFPNAPPITILGNNNSGDIWVNTVLNAEWEVNDYVEGDISKGLGSGANLFRYRVRRFDGGLPEGGGVPVLPDPFLDWATVQTKQLNNIILPSDSLADNGLFVVVEVDARDLAGNWLTHPVSSWAKIDFTPPTSPGVPFITNQVGGEIPVLDTFSAQWLGAFQDIESGIKSYEWGISTTAVLPPGTLPDVYGWLPTPSAFFTSGTIAQNNLLTEGDRVHAVVRARNFASGLSQTVPSTSALVNVSVRTELDAVPRTGLSPMRVFFSASVDGGTPPYTYTFRFDGTNQREWKSAPTGATGLTTYYNYDLVGDPGLPRPEILARVLIEDANGTVSQKDVIIDIRDDILGAVSASNKAGIHFFAIKSASIVPLWTAKTLSPLTSGTAQLHVESRGSYLVGVQHAPSGGNGNDYPFHMQIDDLLNRTAPSRTTLSSNFTSHEQQISSVTFKANQPDGVLLQVHNSDPAPVGPTVDGWVRRSPVTRTGAADTSKAFAFDPADAAPVSFWGAVTDPDNFARGMILYDHPIGAGGTVMAKIFSGPGGTTEVDTDYSDTAANLTTTVMATADIGAQPSQQPEIGVEAIASRAGYYLVSNNKTPARIYRIRRDGSGFGKVDFITGGTKAPGDLDVTEDGQFLATLVHNGTGGSWSVATGFVTSAAYQQEGWVGPNTAVALDMDDGGTRVAVCTDNHECHVYPVDFDVSPPDVDQASVLTLDLDAAMTGMFGAGAQPSDVSLYRRPNDGVPAFYGVFSEGDVDGNTALNGGPVPTQLESFVIVKGINLDRVPASSLTVRADSGGTPCTGLSPTRAGLPPLAPYGGEASFHPASGDIFHFMKINISGCGGTILPDASPGYDAWVEMDWDVGASTTQITTKFTMDGS